MRKKNKLVATSRIRRALFERDKTEVKKRFRKPIKHVAERGISTIDDRSLNLTFEGIPYLEINNEARDKLELTVKKLKNSTSFLNLKLNGNASQQLLNISKELDKIGKETNTGWFLSEADNELVVVFYYEFDELTHWFCPRLKFLSQLKKRSVNWYNVVVNSFQQMTRTLHISDSTDVVWALEWMEERIGDFDNYETEEEQLEAAQLLTSYHEGEVRATLNLVHQPPIMSIDECIDRLRKFPTDLYLLAISIIDLLELCREEKSLIDYDIKYNGGLTETPYEEHLSLDMLFNWVYDYDAVFCMTEEYIEFEVGNPYAQPPSSWRILGDQFTSPKSTKDLKKELTELAKDDWTKRFDKCMDNLCNEINNAYPYK